MTSCGQGKEAERWLDVCLEERQRRPEESGQREEEKHGDGGVGGRREEANGKWRRGAGLEGGRIGGSVPSNGANYSRSLGRPTHWEVG